MRRSLLMPLALVLVLLVSACAPLISQQPATEAVPTPLMAEEMPAESQLPDIVDTAVAAGSFQTLVTALQTANLDAALKGEGPFTVFAPTDDAFAKLPADTIDQLLSDTETLSKVLLYHVVPGQVMASDVTDGLTAETLEGSSLTFTVSDGVVKVNDAVVTTTDIKAANGVIHVIDTVILPPAVEMPAAEEGDAAAQDIVDTAVTAGQFNTLVTAVQAAGLVDALKGEGPFTVFAPTDDAFAKLPAETLQGLLADPQALGNILLYHVISGAIMAADVADGMSAGTLQGSPVTFSVQDGTVKINDAAVVATDIKASNGVIHVIDSVILPPAEGAAAAPQTPETPAGAGDIVDTAVAAGQFNTLLAAAEAAGLVETLRGDGPFTVFAPTDEAFAKLPAGSVESLLADPAKLKDVLLYHVVSGQMSSEELVNMGFVTTLLGRSLPINKSGNDVAVKNAKVVAPDVQASNGVIHVIDTVLLP